MTATKAPPAAVENFREAAPLLRRPFTPEAVKFKVQATWPKDNPTGGLVVAYIDARLAVERLNLIVPHLWTDAYEATAKGLMWCHLTVDGITRSDVGEGLGKGLVSDALKRAAVKFGVGVSLYAIPKMFIDVPAGHAKRKTSREGVTLEMTPAGENRVRGIYRMWLDANGTQAFGDPLDHGDVEDAAGDAEVEEHATPDAPQPRTANYGSHQPNASQSTSSDLVTAADIKALTKVAKDKGLTVAQIKQAFVECGLPRPEGPPQTIFTRVPREKAALLAEAFTAIPAPELS